MYDASFTSIPSLNTLSFWYCEIYDRLLILSLSISSYFGNYFAELPWFSSLLFYFFCFLSSSSRASKTFSSLLWSKGSKFCVLLSVLSDFYASGREFCVCSVGLRSCDWARSSGCQGTRSLGDFSESKSASRLMLWGLQGSFIVSVCTLTARCLADFTGRFFEDCSWR